MSAQIVAIHVQHSLVIVYPSRNMLYLRFLVCFMINIKSVDIKFTEVVLDVLSRILDTLHFDSSFYFATDFFSPWSLEVPNYRNVARFHYVERGLCWVRIEGHDEAIRLSAGDLIVIPHGARHILSDTSDRPPISLDDAMARNDYLGSGVFKFGDGDESHGTKLVCGHFEFSESFKHPFLKHLPVHITKQKTGDSSFAWLKDTLSFLSYTAIAPKIGSSAVIKRLSEVMFIEMVRYWSTNNKIERGFLAALNDPGLAKGLLAFHQDASATWTVEKMAVASNMSRSLFAEKFKHYLEETPMQYVTSWRMENAKRLLKASEKSLEVIANSVGYESAAAFSKAFRRSFDQTPGDYRRGV